MNWTKFGKGAWKVLKLAYDHPETIEAIATITGHPGVAAGIATAVNLAHGATAPQAPAVAPVPASLPAEPAAPAVEPPPAAPPVAEPAPAPAPAEPGELTEAEEKAYRRRVKVLYKNSVLNRYPTDEQEYQEAIALLVAGREDELLRNLDARGKK